MTGKNEDDSAAEERPVDGLAGEVVEAFEHLGESKSAKKAAKSAKKAEKKEAKQAKKLAKKAAKEEQVEHEHDDEPRLTPKKARNAIAVAKVVVPAAVPALAPFAVRAAGSAREAYDRYQARRLGVDVDRLAEFSGRGAALHARIAGLSDGLAELRKLGPGGEKGSFADRVEDTLRQLTATVRASERMPSARRKAAHRAVAGELDQLEGQLLQQLGN